MEEDELNPKNGGQKPNQDEEDEFDFEFEEDEDAGEEDVPVTDEEAERIALDIHNKKTGKNFKSWDDVAKSVKEADKAFAQNPQKKKPEETPAPQAQPVKKPEVKPQTLDANVVKQVMFLSFPELRTAPETLSELKEAAELKGVSELSLYESNQYLQNKAKAESNIQTETDKNKGRIAKPSGSDGGVPKMKVTKEDVKMAEKFFGGDIKRYMKNKVSK
jgi:hypothetical protein